MAREGHGHTLNTTAIECLLADLRVSQLEDAATDTTVAAVFDKCGVDPEVLE